MTRTTGLDLSLYAILDPEHTAPPDLPNLCTALIAGRGDADLIARQTWFGAAAGGNRAGADQGQQGPRAGSHQ